MKAIATAAQTFGNVFDALADTPAEAANMKARADLLAAVAARVRSWQLSQEAAASRLGITRPRLNDLDVGRLDRQWAAGDGHLPHHGHVGSWCDL